MVLSVLRPVDLSFPWVVYLVPNALFPLMLLFLWLDFSKYSVYEPLYKSGKCICVIAVIGWYVFSSRSMLPFEGGSFVLTRIMAILVCSDLFTVMASVLITIRNKKNAVREGE